MNFINLCAMNGNIIIIIIIIIMANILIPCVTANGRLIEPAMRSSLWRFDSRAAVNFNDHALDCGGPQVQYKINRGRCGVCGDPFNAPRENELGGRYDSKIIARRYRTGSDITMVADLLSAKGGFIEIKLCPRNDPTVPVTQACFDQYPLRITNGRGRRLRVEDSSSASNGLYRLDVRLPRGVACTHCVIQWRYHAANEWGYDANGRGCLGCGPQTDIYNCADVTIGYYGDREASAGQPADLSMGPLSERMELYSEGTGVSTLIVNSDHNSAWASGNDLTTSSGGRNNNNNKMAGTDYYYDGGEGRNVDYGDISGGYANLLSAVGGNVYDYNTEDDFGFNAMIMMMGAGGGSDSSEEVDFRSGNRMNGVRLTSVRNGGSRRGGSRVRGQQQQRRRNGGGSSGSSEEEGGRNNRNNYNNNRNNAMVIPSLSRQYRRMNTGSRGRNGAGSSEEEDDDDNDDVVSGGRNGNRQTGRNNAQNREQLIDGLNELAERIRNNNNNNNNNGYEDKEYDYNTNNNVPTGSGNTNTRPNYPNNRDNYEYPTENAYGEEDDYGTGSKSPSEFDSTDVPPYFQEQNGNANSNGGYGTDTGGIDYNTGTGGYDGREPSGNGGYNNQGQTPTSNQGGGYGTPTAEPATRPNGDYYDEYYEENAGTNQNGGGYGPKGQSNSNNYDGVSPNQGDGRGGNVYDSQNQTPITTTGGSGYHGNNQNVDGYDNYNNNNNNNDDDYHNGGNRNGANTDNYGTSPNTDNYGTSPNTDNYGTSPNTDNYGTSPNTDNYGTSPNTDNYGTSPNTDNFGTSPNTDNYGTSPNTDNYGTSPNTDNYGTSPNTDNYGTSPNTDNYGTSPNTDNYGTSPNTDNYGTSPNTDNYGTSPNTDNYGTSPNTDNYGTSPNTDNYGTSPNTDNYGTSSNTDNYGTSPNTDNYGTSPNTDNYGTSPNTDNYGTSPHTSTGGFNDVVDNTADGYDDDALGLISDVEESGTGIRVPYTHKPGQHPPLLPRAEESRDDKDGRRPSSKKKRVGPLPWYMALMGTWPYNYQLGLHNQYQMGPWGVHLNPALMASSYAKGQVPFSHIAALLSTLNAPHAANAPTRASPAYYAYANNNHNNMGARSAHRVLPWMPSATEVMAMGARRSPIFSPQIANNYMSSFTSLSHSHPSLQCPRPDQLICVATPAYRGIPNADQICTSKCRSGGACGSDYCSCACQKTLMCVHHASPKRAGSFGVTEMDVWCTNQCNAGQCPDQLCACNILF